MFLISMTIIINIKWYNVDIFYLIQNIIVQDFKSKRYNINSMVQVCIL